jgi:hypothetical protein
MTMTMAMTTMALRRCVGPPCLLVLVLLLPSMHRPHRHDAVLLVRHPTSFVLVQAFERCSHRLPLDVAEVVRHRQCKASDQDVCVWPVAAAAPEAGGDGGGGGGDG